MIDAPGSSNVLKFSLLADDTSILFKSSNFTAFDTALNTEPSRISVWLVASELSFNVKKTNFVIVHPVHSVNVNRN